MLPVATPTMCVCYLNCRLLYKQNLFPKNTRIVGYARSAITVPDVRLKAEPFMKVSLCGMQVVVPLKDKFGAIGRNPYHIQSVCTYCTYTTNVTLVFPTVIE